MHWPKRLPANRTVKGLVESVQVAPTILDVAGLPSLSGAQGSSLLPRILRHSFDTPEHVCSYTAHNHQREFGPPQFDHYAIQTLDYKFIRVELHVKPDALHSDWKRRFQTVMLRAGQDPCNLQAGTVIRELYDLRVDPDEQRSLIRLDHVYETWPRFPRFVTPSEAQEIARALALALNGTLKIA